MLDPSCQKTKHSSLLTVTLCSRKHTGPVTTTLGKIWLRTSQGARGRTLRKFRSLSPRTKVLMVGKLCVHLTDLCQEGRSLSSGSERHSRILKFCQEAKVGETPQHGSKAMSKAASSCRSRSGAALLPVNHRRHISQGMSHTPTSVPRKALKEPWRLKGWSLRI